MINFNTQNNSGAYQPTDFTNNGFGLFNNGFNRNYTQKARQAPAPAAPSMPMPAYLTDPFGTAMSGTQSGTLQPFINRNTQSANDALYGGLLNQAPQNLVAGDAGGTPVNPPPSWFNIPSDTPTPNQAQIGLLGAQMNKQPMFGNRSWMEA